MRGRGRTGDSEEQVPGEERGVSDSSTGGSGSE